MYVEIVKFFGCLTVRLDFYNLVKVTLWKILTGQTMIFNASIATASVVSLPRTRQAFVTINASLPAICASSTVLDIASKSSIDGLLGITTRLLMLFDLYVEQYPKQPILLGFVNSDQFRTKLLCMDGNDYRLTCFSSIKPAARPGLRFKINQG